MAIGINGYCRFVTVEGPTEVERGVSPATGRALNDSAATHHVLEVETHAVEAT